jgi:hypothetical protein
MPIPRLLQVSCRKCNAPIGQPCHKQSLGRHSVHAIRREDSTQLPVVEPVKPVRTESIPTKFRRDTFTALVAMQLMAACAADPVSE